MLPTEVLEAVESLLDLRLINHRPLSGGCINAAFRSETTQGDIFLKFNDARRYPGMFHKEAKGLALLEQTNTFFIPPVLLEGENKGYSFLVMEYVPKGSPATNFGENFGEQLADMHRSTALQFGLDHDNYIGSLVQKNTLKSSYVDFLVQERFTPQLEMALASGELNGQDEHQFERLFGKLSNCIPQEPPSLLHGDLWSGNFMVAADGQPCLIDPAVYYGHRESELAMTLLFGGFPAGFYEGYEQSWPLAPGFQERVDLYNLYPLLVHVNLFGGGYASQVRGILRRFA